MNFERRFTSVYNGHKSGHSGLILSLKRLVYTQKVTGSSPACLGVAKSGARAKTGTAHHPYSPIPSDLRLRSDAVFRCQAENRVGVLSKSLTISFSHVKNAG